MQNFSPSYPKLILSAYSKKIPHQLDCPEKPFGRTKQSFKAECDINTIIKRFLKTGVLDFVAKNEPRYGDVTGLEYTQACLTVAAAKSLFAELPAALRNRFENEPAKFLEFVQNDANYDEALKLGLVKAKVEPEVVPGTPLAPAPNAAPIGAPKPA